MSASRELETYRGHKLLAAEHQGGHVGRIWKDDELILQINGESVKAVLQALRDKVDQTICEIARQNGTIIPEIALTKAFQKILGKLSDGQRAMLKAHYHAPMQEITATELAKAAGYAGWSPANLHYGNVGAMLYDEAPVELSRRRDGSLIYTSYLASPGGEREDEKEWLWKLRPEVARVMEHFGLHI